MSYFFCLKMLVMKISKKKKCSLLLKLIKSIVAGDSYTILGLYSVTFKKHLKDYRGKLVIVIGFH